jgi:hypothetical protein
MKIPMFLQLGKKYLKTDLTTREILQISSFARQVDPEKGFSSATLPGKFYEAYWQPDPDQVKKLMLQLKPATLKK